MHATKAWKESEGQFGKDKDRRLTMIQPTEPIVDSVVPRTSGQRGRPQLPQGRVVRAEAVGLLERGRVRLLLLLSGPLRPAPFLGLALDFGCFERLRRRRL